MEHYKSRRGQSLSTLDSLVAELLKDRPNERVVKDFMTKIGLPYSVDSITRMETVLDVLKTQQKVPGKKEIS